MKGEKEVFTVCREVNRETGEVAVYRVEELTQILGVHLLVSDETLRRFGIVKI